MPTTTAARIRAHRGPAILSFGFRPFFLGGGIWAALAMLLWLLFLTGQLPLPLAMGAIDWHVHELLYGYLPAVVAGFLLTAVPNWTGRLPVTGMPLLGLFLLWLAGRLAVMTGAWLGFWAMALLDLAFLAVLIAVIAQELIAGGNRRNLPVLLLVGLLLIGNALFHYEAAAHGAAVHGTRLGIAAILLLVMLIGGRIVPSFTRNWLMKNAPTARMPAAFGRFDGVALVLAGIALAAWIAAPQAALTAALAILAGVVQAARLARWSGERSGREPLLLILHLGYAFVPLGFFLHAASWLWPATVWPVAAIHAWTAGAVGTMTLAVMTRASLGHSGRALTANRATTVLYGLILAAALARILAGTSFGSSGLQHLSALLWCLAFTTFAVAYWPALVRLPIGKQKPG